MTSDTETFQISVDAAEMYESEFVPKLFGEWALLLVEAAGVSQGQRALDVACGTGIVARTTADRVGAGGSVVGLDKNPAMLAVAERLRPDLEWREGDAASLPFPDRSFDIVLCQAALMFFPHIAPALEEMARVVKDDGTVAIQVWDRWEAQPAYRPFIEVAARHAGPEAINLLSSYFSRGDLEELRSFLQEAGLEVTSARTEATTLHFNSVEQLVMTEVQSTPLGERLTDEVLARIIEDASRDALPAFMTEDGRLEIPIRGHLVTSMKP